MNLLTVHSALHSRNQNTKQIGKATFKVSKTIQWLDLNRVLEVLHHQITWQIQPFSIVSNVAQWPLGHLYISEKSPLQPKNILPRDHNYKRQDTLT